MLCLFQYQVQVATQTLVSRILRSAPLELTWMPAAFITRSNTSLRRSTKVREKNLWYPGDFFGPRQERIMNLDYLVWS